MFFFLSSLLFSCFLQFKGRSFVWPKWLKILWLGSFKESPFWQLRACGFASWEVDSVFHLSTGQTKFLGEIFKEIQLQNYCNRWTFWALVRMNNRPVQLYIIVSLNVQEKTSPKFVMLPPCSLSLEYAYNHKF